jgi:hypothetical protein
MSLPRNNDTPAILPPQTKFGRKTLPPSVSVADRTQTLRFVESALKRLKAQSTRARYSRIPNTTHQSRSRYFTKFPALATTQPYSELVFNNLMLNKNISVEVVTFDIIPSTIISVSVRSLALWFIERSSGH